MNKLYYVIKHIKGDTTLNWFNSMIPQIFESREDAQQIINENDDEPENWKVIEVKLVEQTY